AATTTWHAYFGEKARMLSNSGSSWRSATLCRVDPRRPRWLSCPCSERAMMARSAAGVALAAWVIVLLSGGGTASNLGAFGGEPAPLKVYGGVERSIEHANRCVKQAMYPEDVGDCLESWVVAAYAFVVDAPLSAFADTLTLHLTIPAEVDRYYSR